MGRKVFGPASEFYRARLMTLEVPEAPLLEWREDVLYRSSSNSGADDGAPPTFAVELVNIDTERSLVLFSEPSQEDAQDALEVVLTDIASLTKAEFDAKYHVVPPVV